MDYSILISTVVLHLVHTSLRVTGQAHNGLFLSLKGTPIDDDGFVTASDIGVSNDGLLCLTDETNCCGNSEPGPVIGDWYFPNGTRVDDFNNNGGSINNDFFSRNRGPSVVRLHRFNSPSERGRFRCELLGDTIYVNILTIGPVSGISPFTPATATAGQTVNLQCSVDITPHPLPANTSTPEFEWFFGQTFNSPLTSTTTNRSSTYSSTLQLTSVSESDGGKYTCRLRGNHKTAVSTTLSVEPVPLIAVTSNPTGIITVGSSVTLTCTVELSPSVDVPVTVNIVWTGPAGFMTTNTAQPVMGSTTTYISTAIVNSLGRDQSGDYTCTATVSSMSSNVMATSSIRVIIGSPPPLNVVASQASPSDPVEVSWSPPSGGATTITGYTIFYGNGANVSVPFYVTRIFVELVNEESVSIRSESTQLPSETIQIAIESVKPSQCESVSPSSLQVGITVGIVLLVILIAAVIVTSILLCWWRKSSSHSESIKSDFTVRANVAYGDVTLEPGALYEDLDKVVKSVEGNFELMQRSAAEYERPVDQPAATVHDTAGRESAKSSSEQRHIPEDTEMSLYDN